MWARRTQYGFPGPKPFGPWPYILVEYFGPAGPLPIAKSLHTPPERGNATCIG